MEKKIESTKTQLFLVEINVLAWEADPTPTFQTTAGSTDPTDGPIHGKKIQNSINSKFKTKYTYAFLILNRYAKKFLPIHTNSPFIYAPRSKTSCMQYHA